MSSRQCPDHAMAYERRILKSWKEVAAYMGVGLRTAQRWYASRGLPVRQPGASRKSAVLAFSDEIDRWLGKSGPRPRELQEGPRPELSGTVATDVLWNRASRPRQTDEEVEALVDIGRLIALRDQGAVLSRIGRYARLLCKAESAGFSIIETEPRGTEVFRWTATSGVMKKFEGGTTPANFSPCGFCLERNSAQLFTNPEKFYAYLRPIAPITELLLIPMHDEYVWVGTIWIISHRGRRKFDREDARLMTELGTLASATFAGRLSECADVFPRRLPRTEPPKRSRRRRTDEVTSSDADGPGASKALDGLE
jgi:hypothetical protein